MGTQTHPRVPWKGMETPDSRNVAGQPCPGLASVCPNGPMSMLGLAQPPLGGGEYREGACVGRVPLPQLLLTMVLGQEKARWAIFTSKQGNEKGGQPTFLTAT